MLSDYSNVPLEENFNFALAVLGDIASVIFQIFWVSVPFSFTKSESDSVIQGVKLFCLNKSTSSYNAWLELNVPSVCLHRCDLLCLRLGWRLIFHCLFSLCVKQGSSFYIPESSMKEGSCIIRLLLHGPSLYYRCKCGVRIIQFVMLILGNQVYFVAWPCQNLGTFAVVCLSYLFSIDCLDSKRPGRSIGKASVIGFLISFVASHVK